MTAAPAIDSLLLFKLLLVIFILKAAPSQAKDGPAHLRPVEATAMFGLSKPTFGNIFDRFSVIVGRNKSSGARLHETRLKHRVRVVEVTILVVPVDCTLFNCQIFGLVVHEQTKDGYLSFLW